MSTDDSLQKRKDEIVRRMSEMDLEAQRKEQQASETVRNARLSRDMNRPLLDLVKTAPVEFVASPVWDQHLDAMREWLGVVTNESLSFPTMVSTFSAVTAAVANTCVTTMYTVSSESKAAGVRIDAIETAEALLGELIRPSELLPRVHQSMSRLGLDGSRGGAGRRPPMDLLDEAHRVLTLGEGQATSVLMPLRGCIGSRQHKNGAAEMAG